MQETKWDGEINLIDAPPEKQLQKESMWDALLNKENKSVTLHKPGSIVTMQGGRKYVVDEKGTWRRLDKLRSKDAQAQ